MTHVKIHNILALVRRGQRRPRTAVSSRASGLRFNPLALEMDI